MMIFYFPSPRLTTIGDRQLMARLVVAVCNADAAELAAPHLERFGAEIVRGLAVASGHVKVEGAIFVAVVGDDPGVAERVNDLAQAVFRAVHQPEILRVVYDGQEHRGDAVKELIAALGKHGESHLRGAVPARMIHLDKTPVRERIRRVLP